VGDDRKGRIVRTVHAHGYAFVAEATEDAESGLRSGAGRRRRPVCWLISPTRALPLVEGMQIIGRDPVLDLFLDSPKVSRRHARIEINGPRATIEDLGSKNGSFVRHRKIAAPTLLQDGDEIQIGRFAFVFRRHAAPTTTETEE
jgi:hypothetical protein